MRAAGAHQRDDLMALLEGLRDAIPDLAEHGAAEHRVAGFAPVGIPGCDSESLLVLLDLGGVDAAAGSSCASGATEPSHVLTAMGFPSASAARALRFSSGPAATAGEWAQLARALAGLANSAAR